MVDEIIKNFSQPERLPPPPENHPARDQLWDAVVVYNATGNHLALWKALEICLEHDYPVPKELAAIFRQMAHRLVALSLDKISKARSHVLKIVLGTDVIAGGDPVFKPYRQYFRDRKRLAIVEALVSEHVINKRQPYYEIAEPETNSADYETSETELSWEDFEVPEPETNSAEGEGQADTEMVSSCGDIEYAWPLLRVYDEAAKRLRCMGDRVEPEALKRLFEQYDKDMGTFKTNALLTAIRKTGVNEVVEVDHTPRKGKRN